MATDPPIGTKIARRRQVLGMTQQDLAAELGVSKSTVANWETGKHFPRRYIGRVEDVLGISLDGNDGRFRAVSDDLRRQIAKTLPGDVEAQRRVIGLLEGTLSWPDTNRGQSQANGSEEQERSAR